jgi:dienelactone hydrolase
MVHTEFVEYVDQGLALEGYAAWDKQKSGPRPGVLIAHAWGGQGEFEQQKAQRLAELGYVGFALDMYGKGKRGTSPAENSKLMQPFLDDRALLRRRIKAGHDAMRKLAAVGASKTAVMGFCFGGLCALDLGRSGAPVAGVVSFHGLFAPAGLADNPKKLACKVLALHGHDDPMVPPAQVAAFQAEMTAAGVDWQVHVYGGTMHAFTNPAANDRKMGTVYQERADRRSWQAMKEFLAEVLGG